MTYYRLHRADAPTFSTENAWSAAWGETFSQDGTQYECRSCDAEGVDAFGEECADCGGEGYLDADRGYSCCDSSEELLAYFGQHYPADADDPVVVFEGDVAGTGCDGEPLVVPTAVVRWTTMGELDGE